MITIHAEHRKWTGTNNSRKLRTQNKCPAILYGKSKPNIPITINKNTLVNIEKNNKLQTDTITLIINDNIQHLVKISHIQYHPFKKIIIHIDFLYLTSNTNKKKAHIIKK